MRRRKRFPIWLGTAVAALAVLAAAQKAPLPSAGGTWVFQGPAPLTVPNPGDPLHLGGTVASLMATQSGLLAGTAGGGIWQWQGGAWEPESDAAPSLAISALARDAASGKFYAGTGDLALADDGASAVGLLASSDGVSWQQLPGSSVLAGLTVTAIWIDPNDSQHLLVATASSQNSAGVYRSSDGGGTWTQLAVGQAWSLAEDPDSLRLFAGVGASLDIWTVGGSPVPVSPAPVAGTASDPVAGYRVAATSGQAGVLGFDAHGNCLGIAVTSDATNWTPLACPSATVATLAYDPSSTLWAGGGNVWKFVGGVWQPTASSGPAARGAIDALLFTGAIAWAGGAGGVWELAPGGSWQDQVGGPGTAALGAVPLVAADAAAAGLIGATAAGDAAVVAGSLAWNTAPGTTATALAAAPSDPETVYAASSAGLSASGNGGSSYGAEMPPPSGSSGSPVLAVDPTTPAHVFWASSALWQSFDGGHSWAAAPPSAPTGNAFTAFAIAPQDTALYYLGSKTGQVVTEAGASATPAAACTAISVLAVDPDSRPAAAASAPNTVLAGCGGASGGLYLSTDGGMSWAAIGGALPALPVVAARFDPVDPQVVYAALTHGVFASPDRGVTWYQLGSGLPNAVLTSLRPIAPVSNTRALLVATAGRGAWTLPLNSTAAPLTAVSGGGQSGAVGQALAQPLVVAAHNAFGLPLAGIGVTWSDGGAGGSFAPATAVTGADGETSALYTLPKKAGPVAIAVNSSFAGANFSVAAVAGAAASVTALAGSGQTAVEASPLPQPVVAQVADRDGNPVSGVAVTFSNGGAGGSFTAASGVTNAQGQVGTDYTLPPSVGTVTLTAAAPGLPPAVFAETAVAAPDFTLTLSPTSQSADVASTVTFQLAASAPASDTRVIDLTCSTPATGCSIAPGSISPGGRATVSVDTATFVVGSNSFTVEASDGLHTQRISGTVAVLPPDFALTLTAPASSVDQVAANSFTVATEAIHGGFKTLTLTCVSPAQGCSFAPAQVAPGQASTLTVAANTLAAGAQTVTIEASDGTNTHTASVAIAVVPPGLTLALATTAQTVSAGHAANTALAVTPVGGLSGLVALSCSGLPADAACAFQPPTWTSAGTGSASIALTVSTTANAAAVPPVPGRRWPLLVLLSPWLALIALRRRASRGRARWRLAGVLALALAAGACGGAGAAAPAAAPPLPTGTPPGTYSVKVVATAGTISAQTTLKLTVN